MLSLAGIVDEDLIELLTEALDRIGPADSPLRSQLLSGLAQELYWVDAAGRSNDLGLEALEMARRLDDPESLALALVRRQFTGTFGPDQTRRRLAEADELHALAKDRGDRELELRSHVYRLTGRLALGEIPAVDAELAAVDRLATELRQPGWLWNVPMLRAMRALIAGRFAEAEALSGEGLALGLRAGEPVAAQFHATQIALLRRHRRAPEDDEALGELTERLAELAQQYQAIPAWRCSLAATHAELGHEREARAVFEPLAANDFVDLPRDQQWMISLTLLAETACFLRDTARGARLYELLEPHAGLNVVAGRAAASLRARLADARPALASMRAWRPGRTSLRRCARPQRADGRRPVRRPGSV